VVPARKSRTVRLLNSWWTICGLALLASWPAQGHEFFSTKVTWSREISRIVVKSCQGCHREGGKAFSLTTFEDARPWAKAIKEEVLNRRMPPWGVVKGFGSFDGDQGLSQDEISLIADWVEGGAPEGDKSYLPKMMQTSPKVAAGKRLILPELALPLSAPVAKAIHIAGIVPRGGVDAGTQVVAQLPDGSMEPLIWVIEPKAATQREFTFREPKTLPAGTLFTVSKPGGSWKILLPPVSGGGRAKRPE
jgi:mono/diheme cytochrome c family protein